MKVPLLLLLLVAMTSLCKTEQTDLLQGMRSEAIEARSAHGDENAWSRPNYMKFHRDDLQREIQERSFLSSGEKEREYMLYFIADRLFGSDYGLIAEECRRQTVDGCLDYVAKLTRMDQENSLEADTRKLCEMFNAGQIHGVRLSTCDITA